MPVAISFTNFGSSYDLIQYHLTLLYDQKGLITLNMTFSVTYCLGLHNAKHFYYWWKFCQVKMLMFYTVQTTNVTFVGKIYSK